MDFSVDFSAGVALYRFAGDTLSSSSGLGWSSSQSTPINITQGSTQGDKVVVTRTLSTIQDLMDLLSTLSIQGPLMLTDKLTHTFIAKGSQFDVYKNSWFESGANTNDLYITKVAVKKCIFKLTSDTQLDLSTDAARRQVHDMCLEISALSCPQLRNHRNIVKLLGYSVDNEDWHAAPLLVQELAVGDLQKVLNDPQFDLSWDAKHQLCLDIAAALDASHACGIAHGDLKPQNVLVFRGPSTEVPFVAKLADFGYCSTSASASDAGIRITGWTPGWCAPEIYRHVQEGRSINNAELMKADNYSFGLVVWIVMCRGGRTPQPPPKSAADAVKDLLACPTIPRSLCETLGSALVILMRPVVSERPAVISDILQDDSQACRTWNRACEEYHAPPAAAEQEETPSPFIHSWDIPFLDAFMLVGLDKTFETYKDSLSGAQLFAMFLVKSFYDGSRGDLPTVQTKILITAAERGFVPAQAVAYRVLQSHRQQLPAHISPKTAKTWLLHGASTGSLVAAQDLGAIDMESCERARAEFRRNGGYNQFYSPTARPPDLNLPESESRDIIEKQRNSRIHELATYGCLEYLTELLNDTDAEADVNARNAFGETGLYKACMAGCWQTVSLLSRRGATASITESLDGISCLHWLFNFPPEHIPTVARLLVEANGDPNTLTHATSPIVQYHFPFTWPPGTPLHWAVAASSATAVKVLLELGADPTLRNRTDAYKYEHNVRVFDRHEQSTQVGSYSTTPEGCKGLSAIDLAVAQHDAEVLSLLLARVAEPDLVDEEGYTPLHRLCSLRIGRTVSGAHFWYPSFLGAATDSQQTAMLHTISLLQSSINKLTQPRNNVFEIGRGGLTPLMLAIMALNAAAVRALLALGSDIDVSNLTGYTALEVLSHRKEHEPYTSPQAFAAIMDSFVEHYRVANRLPSEVTSLLEVAVSNGLLDIESLLPYVPIDTDKMSFLARLMVSEDVFTRDGKLKLPQRDTHLRKHLEVYVAGGGSVCGGDGLLHHACKVGLTGCVSFLISAGAEVNAVVKGTAAVVAGTPLDVVEQRKMQLCDRVESGRSHVSKLEVQDVLKCLEEVEGTLRANDGKRQIEL